MHISVWATAAERQKVESAIQHLITMFAAHDVIGFTPRVRSRPS
jgi:hypothetical protein